MKIFVKAKPNAREEKVEQPSEMHFTVAVKEPPAGGRANEAIVKALSEYFKIPKSQVRITSGHTSRQKVAEIEI